MPKLIQFRIQNFRGIRDETISVDRRDKSEILSLIGLNESGKTTILEALSHFSTGDRAIPNLLAEAGGTDHYISMLPIDQRANFTGRVTISAEIEVSVDELNSYAKKIEGQFSVQIKAFQEPICLEIDKVFHFKDSNFEKISNFWSGLKFDVKKKKQRKFRAVAHDSEDTGEYWQAFVNAIKFDLFELVYFPSFLVDIPSVIYLEEHPDETPVNLYYRKVMQDVLSSLPGDISLEKHVIARLHQYKERLSAVSWFTSWLVSSENKPVKAVINQLEAALNQEIIQSWSRVFQHDLGQKRFKVEFAVDSIKSDLSYVKFSLIEAGSDYELSERSLGFRWFFSYLLFTQFRAKTERPTLFLFDEPAANLHAKAQSELLKSFGRIVASGNKIFYSTHSPHMINPDWLSSAFIIQNAAIDVDKGQDLTGTDTGPTDIKVKSYPRFVSDYPDKTTYFQPVYEKLLYENPLIIGKPPYLCFEGISDFYLFSYVARISERNYFTLVPRVGAGSQAVPLPEAYGIGSECFVLLDDDLAGHEAKEKILEKGGIDKDNIAFLSDFSQNDEKILEDLIGDETRNLIKAKWNGACGKKQIRAYLREACSSVDGNYLCADTVKRVANILDASREQMMKSVQI